MEREIKWWGYRHTNGSYQAKVYFSELDTREAEESPFCEKVFYPFMAAGREDALQKIEEMDNADSDR